MDGPEYLFNPYFGSVTFAPVEPGEPIAVESASIERGYIHLLLGRPNTPYGEIFPVLGCFSVGERGYLVVQPLDWMGDGYGYEPVIVRVLAPGIVTTVSDAELLGVITDWHISAQPNMESARFALIREVWGKPEPTREDIDRMLRPVWGPNLDELKKAEQKEPVPARHALQYESLLLTATYARHQEPESSGYLQGVIRIEAYAHWRAHMELLERERQTRDGKGESEWRLKRSELPVKALDPLAAAIANLWQDGQPPRIDCQDTANEAWVSLDLTVHLDAKTHTLHLPSIDDTDGPDMGSLREVASALANLVETLNPKSEWSRVLRMV